MNTEQNIRRLELALASPFWQDATRRYDGEKMTLQITGDKGAYRWQVDDTDESSYGRSSGSFASLRAAKDDLFSVLEDGLRRQRGQLTSTH